MLLEIKGKDIQNQGIHVRISHLQITHWITAKELKQVVYLNAVADDGLVMRENHGAEIICLQRNTKFFDQLKSYWKSEGITRIVHSI